ncbi:MAG: adenosylcobalamin-dependent ribonucleoside-diphosphate reductase [Chloroflexi bacterium]|nr:adenosylcobalamin-dependent ribonucleoside-diphosphate reductase [Chloroflexota bacterium]
MFASTITQVKKRDGRIVRFEPAKIEAAIAKAFTATGTAQDSNPSAIATGAIRHLEEHLRGLTPSVEEVQDAVEEALMGAGFPAVAKAYILYRQKRTEVRQAKELLGVRDELKLTVNAIKVLERRYLQRNEQGLLMETPVEMFRRVAKAIAGVEQIGASGIEDEFYSLLTNLEFLPNSPTLMNAGTSVGQLSACFVIPVKDDMGEIFDAVRDMALIHQSGGGTGFSFSQLRPKGDIVKSTGGIASGPVSFMRVFDTATDVVKQGGRRRGANMGILRVDHPDVLEFIEAKSREGVLTNFNVSVAVTDAFMEAVVSGQDYALISPRTSQEVRRLSARHVFNLIATSAWRSGDPGLVFIDGINKSNPTPQLGPMEATNPCGELPLLPFESCNLGSVNLAKMVHDGAVNWDRLRRAVRLGVRFLDNVIDANRYPLPQIEAITRGNRKIGLGVMGFADMLMMLGIPYDSQEGVDFAERLMTFVEQEAMSASQGLARERGPFANFAGSIHDRPGATPLRNATVTSIAPTGTISIIAGCSSGIEPLFALAYVRNVMEGVHLLEVNPLFERLAHDRGFYSHDLMAAVARSGSVRGMGQVPKEVRRVFVTDFDIAPEWHVRMQAAFQRHCDNAVSKTINLPNTATIDDVRDAFLLAWRLKCKGITVFRYGSKSQQVLYRAGDVAASQGEVTSFVSASSEYAGGCPAAVCEF